MKIEVKSSIILIITFLIGIFVGTLIDRTLARYEFERRIERMRPPHGMALMLERLIQPEDNNQREKIMKIVNNHIARIHEINQKTRVEITTMMDSLKIELEPILTEQQMARFNASMERLKRVDEQFQQFRRGKDRPNFRGRRGMRDDFPPPLPPLPNDQ